MSKKLFLSTLFLGLGLIANAEDTDVSKYENVVFPVSTTGIAGSTVTLSVEMNNTVNAVSFQFDVFLPEGFTIPLDDWGQYQIVVSESRTTSARHKIQSAFIPSDGCIRVICSSNPPVTFVGNSGEVCTIQLNVGDDVAEGEYPIIFKNIEVGDEASVAHLVDQVEATLTIEAAAPPTYDEGYAVKVLPFAYTADNEGFEAYFLMDNLTEMADMEFDVVVPSVFNVEGLYGFDNIFSTRQYSLEDNISSGGTAHVSLTHKSKTIEDGSDNEIVLFWISYSNDIPEGVYPITIKNIKLTDVDGDTYMAAPYTTEIFVGDAPKATVADGVAAFHGDYGETEGFELLKAALPEGATVDLTEVSDFAEDPAGFRTDNVIVTAETISYGRAMSNEWGSLCLPFAVESSYNLQLYELKSASSSAMTFDPVASVEANTPVIFKASGDGFTVKAANDGFDTGFAAAMPKPSIEAITDWVLNGSYSEETIDVSGMQAYGLMNNEFHRFTKTLTAGAFRAWLQNNGEPMNATIRIEDSTEGISIIEQEDGSVKLIFDMQGRQLKENVGQQMIIENGQKVVRYNK